MHFPFSGFAGKVSGNLPGALLQVLEAPEANGPCGPVSPTILVHLYLLTSVLSCAIKSVY